MRAQGTIVRHFPPPPGYPVLIVMRRTYFSIIVALIVLSAPPLTAAAEDRVTLAIDNARTSALRFQSHPALSAGDDRGPLDSVAPIAYATLYLQPASGLEEFLADQQMPSSANYHRWLTPEQFGDRFGLTGNDLSKIVDWLRSQGFTVHDVARGRHWITFSGTAAQAARAFHTELHRYVVNGELHYANSTPLSIPAALESVIAGVAGLDDFRPQPYHRMAPLRDHPDFTSGTAHFLTPDDLATIYDIAPLYASGIDGTGQKLVIVGQTDLNLADLHAYRVRFNLAANDPEVVLYGPDPGTSLNDLAEADLDLEISAAIARNATIVYVNSRSVNLSAQYAVDQNLAPVISMSYGDCEVTSSLALRAVAEQANAQGITWMVSSGDSGAVTCDRHAPTPQASKGATVSSPASFPEVTAVGGTEFNEAGGSYWSATNSASRSSALSYIPERVWNDSVIDNALVAGGGGASAVYPKPVWQSGPGVPNDKARDLPDVSFAASADHDGFEFVYAGSLYVVGGTSASSPLFAGMIALLNQSLASANPKAAAGLGNINPILYRLAQATSDVFHDTVFGDNSVPCAQLSPACLNGSVGYPATAAYDLASGLGSIDAAHLVAEWNAGTASATSLTVNPASYAIGDTVQLTATVTGVGAIPTGSVTFAGNDLELGTAPLVPGAKSSTATLSVAGAVIAGGVGTLGATYSGDATFLGSGGTATAKLQVPASGSYIIPSLNPNPVLRIGVSWPYTLKLTEAAGTATVITAFTISGINNLANLTSPAIPANGVVTLNLVGSGLAAPLNRVYHFEGMDAGGATWSRDLTVPFLAASGPTLSPAVSLSLLLSLIHI